jgi:rubrerythrin
MSKTEQNLQEAFAGESQANRKYLAFAKKAETEGYKNVAKLFRAAAAAETIHAHNHLKELGTVKSTADNLQEAIKGESHEFMMMYPRMIDDARDENNEKALRSFTLANEVEKVHAALYRKALMELGNKQRGTVDYFVCQVCGYTAEGAAPDTCPVCKAAKKAFLKVE